MNLVICLSPDGKTRSFKLDHKMAHALFDNQSLQFCGAVKNAVAVTRLTPREDDATNVFAMKFPQYFDSTKGDILLLGSDANGGACDLDVESILDALAFH